MRHFADGLRLVLRDRTLWPFIWKPLLWTLVAFLFVVVAGWFILVPWVTSLVQSWGFAGSVGIVGGSALYIVLWFFVSGPVFLALAGLLSSLLWDRLGSEVEIREFGRSATEQISRLELVSDTIFRGLFSVFVAVCTLAFGWMCFGIFAVVLAAWLGLLDYSAGAFIRRGVIYPTQNISVWSCPGWFSFSLISGLITLIPFVNVMLVPVLVAGGTLLCARRYPPVTDSGIPAPVNSGP